MADRIQFRRDTSANWASVNPTLAQGELGLETDTSKYKIGNGSTAWVSLPYGSLSGAVGALDFTESGSVPSTPTGAVTLFSKAIGGRLLPAFIGPAGASSTLQPSIARNKIGYWCPPGNATTVPGVIGYTAHTATGTATLRNVATTNLFTRMRRLGYVSAATAAALCGARVAVAQVTVGDGAGAGGFFKVCRFGISDAATVAGARMFVGVSATTGAPTNVEPSTLLNCIGVGHGAADTNLKVFSGGSSAQTPVNLGAGFPITAGSAIPYELALFSPPNLNGVVRWQVTRLDTGVTASGTLTGSGGVILPATTTLLTYMQAWRTNNATALAVGLDVMSDYIETDD